MKATTRSGIAVSGLACLALLGTAAPAVAAPAPQEDEVVIVDQPNTDDLHNKWTFAPLGIPVFGLIDSIAGIPKNLL